MTKMVSRQYRYYKNYPLQDSRQNSQKSFKCSKGKEVNLERQICYKLDKLVKFKNSPLFFFERQKKVEEDGESKRLDIVIHLGSTMKVLLELKTGKRRWRHQRLGAIHQVQAYYYSLPEFFENLELAIITNGYKWEYSFKPFDEWSYINEFIDSDLINVLSEEALFRRIQNG